MVEEFSQKPVGRKGYNYNFQFKHKENSNDINEFMNSNKFLYNPNSELPDLSSFSNQQIEVFEG